MEIIQLKLFSQQVKQRLLNQLERRVMNREYFTAVSFSNRFDLGQGHSKSGAHPDNYYLYKIPVQGI